MSALTFKTLSTELTQDLSRQSTTPPQTVARCTLGRDKVMVLVEYPLDSAQAEPFAHQTLDWLEQHLRSRFDTTGLPDEMADLSESTEEVTVQMYLKHRSEAKPFTMRSFTWKVADSFDELFGEPDIAAEVIAADAPLLEEMAIEDSISKEAIPEETGPEAQLAEAFEVSANGNGRTTEGLSADDGFFSVSPMPADSVMLPDGEEERVLSELEPDEVALDLDAELDEEFSLAADADLDLPNLDIPELDLPSETAGAVTGDVQAETDLAADFGLDFSQPSHLSEHSATKTDFSSDFGSDLASGPEIDLVPNPSINSGDALDADLSAGVTFAEAAGYPSTDFTLPGEAPAIDSADLELPTVDLPIVIPPTNIGESSDFFDLTDEPLEPAVEDVLEEHVIEEVVEEEDVIEEDVIEEAIQTPEIPAPEISHSEITARDHVEDVTPEENDADYDALLEAPVTQAIDIEAPDTTPDIIEEQEQPLDELPPDVDSKTPENVFFSGEMTEETIARDEASEDEIFEEEISEEEISEDEVLEEATFEDEASDAKDEALAIEALVDDDLLADDALADDHAVVHQEDASDISGASTDTAEDAIAAKTIDEATPSTAAISDTGDALTPEDLVPAELSQLSLDAAQIAALAAPEEAPHTQTPAATPDAETSNEDASDKDAPEEETPKKEIDETPLEVEAAQTLEADAPESIDYLEDAEADPAADINTALLYGYEEDDYEENETAEDETETQAYDDDPAYYLEDDALEDDALEDEDAQDYDDDDPAYYLEESDRTDAYGEDDYEETVASVDETEVQRQRELWQKQTRSGSPMVIIGAVGFVFAGIVALLVTQPCVVGRCDRLQAAQQKGDDALTSLSADSSAEAVRASKQELQEAIQLLSPIPAWSGYHDEAQTILPAYEQQLTALDLVTEAQGKAYSAAVKSQNPPHSKATWQEIANDWRAATTALSAVAEDSPVNQLAERKLVEYRANLSTILVRIETESGAEVSLRQAQQAASRATQQTPLAESSEAWEAVLADWESAVENLRRIPQGTSPYAEAQQILPEYEETLQEVRERAEQERSANRLLFSAQQLANEAQQAESSEQWLTAVEQWNLAVIKLKDIPKGVFAHATAQSLLTTYTGALGNAENNMEVSLRFQPVEPSFYLVCGASDSQKCSYSMQAGKVRLDLASGYDSVINESITPPPQRNVLASDAQLVSQSNQLLQQITLLSTQAQIPVELYDSNGGFLARYRPDLDGFVRQ